MAALVRACQTGSVPASVSFVVAASESAPAVETARSLGVDVEIVPNDQPDRLVSVLGKVDWVCLAGYLRLLPVAVLQDHPSRVLNIHPALLPKFGGKGMYGINVHRAVIEAGETESGCTVHYVSEQYDEGATIMQARCPVLPDDTPETLAARVLPLEHATYAEALRRLIDG